MIDEIQPLKKRVAQLEACLSEFRHKHNVLLHALLSLLVDMDVVTVEEWNEYIDEAEFVFKAKN